MAIQNNSFPKAAVREIAALVSGAERSSLDTSLIEYPFNAIIDTIEGIDDLFMRSQIVSQMCAENGYDPHAFQKAMATEDIDTPKAHWPAPLAEAAFYGPVGALTRCIAPYTEADEAGVLISLLTALGNAVGRGPHLWGGGLHYTNEYICLVGESAHARKGTGWNMASYVMKQIDPYWAEHNVVPGISTGEGLIQLVHDDIIKKYWDEEEEIWVEKKEAGGIEDKRCMIWASEFASVLQVMSRPGVMLPSVLREAWDGGVLGNVNKTSPLRATNAHISIACAITVPELINLLGETDTINGFSNRFLWVCVKKARNLPRGGEIPETRAYLNALKEVSTNLGWSRDHLRRMTRTEEAYPYWENLYNEFDQKDNYGVHRSATSRGPQHIMRLSTIYAALDGTTCGHEINEDHIRAAEAVWNYCSDSAGTIFGNSTGNEAADMILDELKESKNGATKKDLKEKFARNKPNYIIENSLNLLQNDGLATSRVMLIGQDLVEVWYPTKKA